MATSETNPNLPADPYGEPPVSGKEDLTRPGANRQFLVWMVLLGIPALLLFLILGQAAEYNAANPQRQVESVAH